MAQRDLQILDRVVDGERLSPKDALYLLEKGRWTALVEAAHEVRNQKHDPQVVSYTAFRVINYTNVCDVDCSFCSFKDEVESDRAYTLTLEQIREKALEAKRQGADQIFFQGGVHRGLPIDYYTDAFQMLQHELGMHVRALSPVELKRMSEEKRIPLPELLDILKEAGMGSVPGAGAEILTENMRMQLSPKKLTAQEWCDVMGECHKKGLPGSANIVFGSTEASQDIIEHFDFIRSQQDITNGFTTFVPWTFQPQTKKFYVKKVPGHEYLKVLALSRLFFDNIDNIETSILVLGKDMGELALRAGANDINSIVIEENVLRSSGLTTLRAAEKFIIESGFTPKRRSLNFDFSPYEDQQALFVAKPRPA
jgi:cyclic dehypoxanthinyl futalosine synthase